MIPVQIRLTVLSGHSSLDKQNGHTPRPEDLVSEVKDFYPSSFIPGFAIA